MRSRQHQAPCGGEVDQSRIAVDRQYDCRRRPGADGIGGGAQGILRIGCFHQHHRIRIASERNQSGWIKPPRKQPDFLFRYPEHWPIFIAQAKRQHQRKSRGRRHVFRFGGKYLVQCGAGEATLQPLVESGISRSQTLALVATRALSGDQPESVHGKSIRIVHVLFYTRYFFECGVAFLPLKAFILRHRREEAA